MASHFGKPKFDIIDCWKRWHYLTYQGYPSLTSISLTPRVLISYLLLSHLVLLTLIKPTAYLQLPLHWIYRPQKCLSLAPQLPLQPSRIFVPMAWCHDLASLVPCTLTTQISQSSFTAEIMNIRTLILLMSRNVLIYLTIVSYKLKTQLYYRRLQGQRLAHSSNWIERLFLAIWQAKEYDWIA